MGYLVRMAWRNVGRNRRRSALAVISVTMAIFMVVFIKGFFGGFMQSMVRNYTRSETGHIRITTQKFVDEARFSPVYYNLPDAERIRSTLEGLPGVSSRVKLITERVSFGVVLTNEGKQKVTRAIAGNLEQERELLMLDRSIVAGGHYPAAEREVAMGAGLARALGYELGDTIKVMAQGADNALHLRKMTLVGLFSSGLRTMDDHVFLMGIDDARLLLRMGASSQQIIIMLKDHRDAVEIAARLQAALNDSSIAVVPWTQIGDIYSLVTMASSIYNFIYLALALLGAIIIGNIMMVVILERRREIGILRALGFTRRDTLVLFVLEGAMLGFIGSLVGAILGMTVNVILHQVGLDLSSMTAVGSFPMDNIVYNEVSPISFLWSVGLGTLVATVISTLPSRRAAGMGIIEAIKAT